LVYKKAQNLVSYGSTGEKKEEKMGRKKRIVKNIFTIKIS